MITSYFMVPQSLFKDAVNLFILIQTRTITKVTIGKPYASYCWLPKSQLPLDALKTDKPSKAFLKTFAAW